MIAINSCVLNYVLCCYFVHVFIEVRDILLFVYSSALQLFNHVQNEDIRGSSAHADKTHTSQTETYKTSVRTLYSSSSSLSATIRLVLMRFRFTPLFFSVRLIFAKFRNRSVHFRVSIPFPRTIITDQRTPISLSDTSVFELFVYVCVFRTDFFVFLYRLRVFFSCWYLFPIYGSIIFIYWLRFASCISECISLCMFFVPTFTNHVKDGSSCGSCLRLVMCVVSVFPCLK